MVRLQSCFHVWLSCWKTYTLQTSVCRYPGLGIRDWIWDQYPEPILRFIGTKFCYRDQFPNVTGTRYSKSEPGLGLKPISGINTVKFSGTGTSMSGPGPVLPGTDTCCYKQFFLKTTGFVWTKFDFLFRYIWF